MQIDTEYLLVLPHLVLQELSWDTPLIDLVCLPACLQAVGVGLGLSGVSELLSHLPITVYLSSTLLPLSSFLLLSVLPLSSSSHICSSRDKKERGIWESDPDLISNWQIWQRRKRRRIWSRGQTSIFMRHHRLNSAQFKEGGCEVCLSCTAGSDSWAEGYLYASVYVCVCVWVNMSEKAQQYKACITQRCVFASHKT